MKIWISSDPLIIHTDIGEGYSVFTVDRTSILIHYGEARRIEKASSIDEAWGNHRGLEERAYRLKGRDMEMETLTTCMYMGLIEEREDSEYYLSNKALRLLDEQYGIPRSEEKSNSEATQVSSLSSQSLNGEEEKQ